mmetsp:Transcript_33488/g.32548  ORF Transcript_33488/g.32548 Transcript_33488/m.32548 type:complete len:376 (-) Transcript_33488:712-1839(-)
MGEAVEDASALQIEHQDLPHQVPHRQKIECLVHCDCCHPLLHRDLVGVGRGARFDVPGSEQILRVHRDQEFEVILLIHHDVHQLTGVGHQHRPVLVVRRHLLPVGLVVQLCQLTLLQNRLAQSPHLYGLDFNFLVYFGFPELDGLAPSEHHPRLLVEPCARELRSVRVQIVPQILDLFQTEGVPDSNAPVRRYREDLLRLLKEHHPQNVAGLVGGGGGVGDDGVDDAKGVGVDQHEFPFSPSSGHQAQRHRYIKGGDVGVVDELPALVGGLPLLFEVEPIKDLHGSIQRSHNKPYVSEVLDAGELVLEGLGAVVGGHGAGLVGALGGLGLLPHRLVVLRRVLLHLLAQLLNALMHLPLIGVVSVGVLGEEVELGV